MMMEYSINESVRSRGLGIYVHFPFCHRRCLYCAFYSQTQEDLADRYVESLCAELDSLGDHPLLNDVRTLYFGGGTPSIVEPKLLSKFCDRLHERCAGLKSLQEFTMEVNPEDVDEENVEAWCHLGVTRFSMGVQTLNDRELRNIGRLHSSAQVKKAARLLGSTGADLSLDLICGLPGQTASSFSLSLEGILALEPDHVSVYMLELEKDSPLRRLVDAGKLELPPEEQVREMYLTMCRRLGKAGYEHYEISNFARRGHRSIHNSRYWDGSLYLGLGASASSYPAPDIRWSNPADISIYIGQGWKRETETLSLIQLQEEFILTHLRTAEGINLKEYGALFGEKAVHTLLARAAGDLASEVLVSSDECLRLKDAEACLVSDAVMVRLMP